MTPNTNNNRIRVERNDEGGGEPDWNPQPVELDRALENQLTPAIRLPWTLRQEINPGHLAEELGKRLDNASHLLVDRLFDYLSNIPADQASRSKNANGLTLPASAIGWLSTQMYPRSNESDPLGVPVQSEAAWMGASMRDRLALLKYLLPRATHLRITNTEWPLPFRKNKSSDRTTDFVGRDVDLSHLSVHSGVTMESSFIGVTPNIQSFLLFYNEMQNKPRVDLKVFPNLSVLFLDQVPPEWIVNLHSLHDKLKLIRSEQGCIFDMTRFLFGSTADASDEDALPRQAHELTKLAYLKLNNSGLGEMSGLRGRRRANQKPKYAPKGEDQLDLLQAAPPILTCPPLSQLPNLISLSLARNEIRTVRTALAGLSSLSNLKRLDLSFNRLRSMKGANYMLGNIKTLVLTGNALENVGGLEKLYSLEILHLDQNNFEDLTDVAGLGNLPDLMSLFLHDNPFIEKDPIRYRVNVLDLFKSSRFYTLLTGATYRNLLTILPALDGIAATKRELIGLRSLTFRRVLPPMETPPLDILNGTGLIMGRESEPEVSKRTEPALQEPLKVPSTIRPKRVTRKVRKGKALVRKAGVATNSNNDSINKLKTSLEKKPLGLPKIEFSAQDVIASLALKPVKPRLVAATNEVNQGTMITVKSRSGQDSQSFASLSTVSQTEGSVHDIVTKTDTLFEQAQAAIDAADASAFEDVQVNLLDNYSAASLVPRVKGIKETKEATPETVWEDRDERAVTPVQKNGKTSPTRVRGDGLNEDDSKARMKLPGKVGKILLDREFKSPGKVGKVKLKRDDRNAALKKSSTIDEVTPRRATSANSQNNFSNPFDDSDDEPDETAILSSRNLSFDAITPGDMNDYLPRLSVDFPERVWDDAMSVTSSLGTGRVSGIDLLLAEDKYRDAEDTSVYDGPEGYKKLSVTVNLELYFRLFVFPTRDPDVDTSFDLNDDLFSKVAIEASPRIQLRPVDRKVAATAVKEAVGSTKLMMGLRETFKKVLQEEIIACGKSAARRVTPHKRLRRGFHGDPAFSDGSIGFSAESRKVVLCTSDAAIYIIPDYDPVSMKLVEQSSRRKFPSPIPQEALFQNGVWPHALARLPIDTLHRITIGFSFQRLTLHFAPSSEVERSVLGNALTFILVTSDKMKTVKLLQHLQDLTKEADELAAGKFPHAVAIDNDDKQVLDALSVAVAPVQVDVVLHYQILQQRWKHGDRGTIRRVCFITDTHIFLLDEDYVGDGSESYDAGSRTLGEVRYNLIDSAELNQVVEVQAASVDPQAITIVVRPQSRLQRNHNWRLYCRDGKGAERLVEDARKAISSVSDETQIS